MYIHTLQLLISKETSHFFYGSYIYLRLVDRIQSDYLYIEWVADVRVTKEVPNRRFFSPSGDQVAIFYVDTRRTNFYLLN